MAEDYGFDPAVTAVMDAFDFYIVPSLNVDGYQYTWTNVSGIETIRRSKHGKQSFLFPASLNLNMSVTTATTSLCLNFLGASRNLKPFETLLTIIFLNHYNHCADFDYRKRVCFFACYL